MDIAAGMQGGDEELETHQLLTPDRHSVAFSSLFTRDKLLILLLFIIDFVVVAGGAIERVSFLRILEQVVCDIHYGSHTTEGECKSLPVQSELVFITSHQAIVDAILGFVLSLTWGRLSERIGLKWMMVLSLCGSMLNLGGQAMVAQLALASNGSTPIWLVTFSPILTVIGGGGTVFNVVAFGILTELTTDKWRPVAFILLRRSGIAASWLFGTIIVGSTMQAWTVWGSYFAGFGLLLLGTLLAFLLPETTKSYSEVINGGQLQDSSISSSPSDEHRRPFRAWKSLALLLLAELAGDSIQTGVTKFAIQFIPKRFGGTISDASKALLVPTLTLIFSPIAMLVFEYSSRTPPERKGTRVLLCLRFALVVATVGLIIMGMSPDRFTFDMALFLASTGAPFPVFTNVLLTILVDNTELKVVDVLMMDGAAQSLGRLVGNFLLPELFTMGMEKDMLGLPYTGIAACCAIATAFVHLVELPKPGSGLDAGELAESEGGPVLGGSWEAEDLLSRYSETQFRRFNMRLD